MIPELRPLQVDLYQRVRTVRGTGKRIIVVQAATGFGKTVWASYLVKQAVGRESRVLFMVHRRRLVDQISSTLHDFQVDHGILMRGESADRGAPVQVASRDTLLSRCVRNEWLGMPPANLVIVDEAHHAANPESEYRRILENYPQATILLLTATPVGPDGEGLGPWAQAIECAAPTSQLVREKYLVPVKCFAPERKKKGKRFLRGIAGDLVESWKSYAEGRPTLLFTTRVKHSLDAVEAFRLAGIPADHMDASTPDGERDRIFEQVANGTIKVLCNVGIVGEGVDVPELSCCQLFCTVSSRVRFLQACGRIMRPSPGKEYGILIDHSAAVFQHGFPDEDTEWTLDGNADEAFAKKLKEGATEARLYCKRCELVYHGSLVCPQCGKAPAKPPKSIFDPPPIETTSELLTEAERGTAADAWSREEKVKHWLRCLAMAKNRNGTFGMAGAVYRKKYGEWPEDGFPCMPQRYEWKMRVAEKYPNFGRKRITP